MRQMRPLLKLLVAALVAGAGAVAAADKDDEPTIASLEEETVEVGSGRSIANSSALARNNYRAFLDLVSADPQLRAEAMRRLGDLELEATEVEQLAANAGAVEFEAYDNAVGLFHALLESYPDYGRNDAVLYQLARAYEVAGQTDDALRALNELVDKYPTTTLIDEVQFRRGEMLFLRRDYNAAELAYAEVVRSEEESRFYEQSLYKLGWSQFKLAWHEDSLQPFFTLLDRKLADLELEEGDDRLSGLSRADRELVEDTFRVLSVSFSYMDGAASINEFLDRRGHPNYSYVIYMNLGDLYLEKERYIDAAETYEAFVARDTYHRKSPLLQVEVIEAYKRGGFPTLVLDAKKSFVDRYGMDSLFWERNPRAENTAVEKHLKDNLTDLAQYYHAEAQRDGSKSDYQEAATWYRKYLNFFPGEPDSANTNFLLAEILFESEDFRAATHEYERTSYDYARHARSAEAGYAAILSYRQHEALLTGAAKESWHQEYLNSALRFGDTYPEHPESGAVLTAIAEDLFQRNEFELAIAVGRNVVGKVPPVDNELARTAWTVVAHSQFDLANFTEAEEAYYALRPFISAEDVAGIHEVDERIASSIYKQGEQARDAGDLETAVTHFRRLGQSVPGSEIRVTAEYDAAAALINLEAWDRAAAVLEQFRRDFPGSEYASDVMQKLAVTYVASGRDAEAAGEFVRIANSQDSPDDVRREALWRASELYRQSASMAAERDVLESIVERYPVPIAESIEARHRLLEIAGETGDNNRRLQILSDIVYVDKTAGAERSDRTRYLAALASLELAEPVRRSFMVMKITQPLAESMDLKKSLMENVLKAYGDAVGYGVAEVTTAATFRLGEVYRQFSKDLMDSERPAGLDELALEQYEILLEEQVFPFEEKAIELFETNAARAADGIWDEWVERSYAELASLMPARYAKSEQGEDVITAMY